MKHPSPEQWMSYLYDELNAGDRTALAGHLHTCPACAAQLDEWRATSQSLQAWKVPAKRARRAPAVPAFQWAAAAAIVLLAGFAVGRFSSPSIDTTKLRAELRQELTQSLRGEIDRAAAATLFSAGQQSKEMVADYVDASETRRTEDNRAILAVLARLESQREADVLALKKDLDTVAVNTDAGLRHTQQQLTQLADYTQPAGVSDHK